MREIQTHSINPGELTSQFTPEVLIFESGDAVDTYSAARIAGQVWNKPNSVLTLPTGNTPIGMYAKLVTLCEQSRLDLSNVVVFNLDEYYPIDPRHPSSYASYMRKKLIDVVPVGEWYIPDGQASDPVIEAQRYRDLLEQHQPVDLAVLGIGPGTTCHIGFNEKGSPIDSTVRYVRLDHETKETNAKLFPDPQEIPEGALTQGVADILRAKQILVIAKGASKAWGIQRSLKGPISSDAPASFLRLHPHVTFILDAEAAKYIAE